MNKEQILQTLKESPEILLEILTKIPNGDLIDLLEQVFAEKIPYPLETEYCRSKYYLGLATSNDLREDEIDAPDWSEWEKGAVAYIDREEYPFGADPEISYGEYGHCTKCNINVRSSVKHGICPICGRKVYMT